MAQENHSIPEPGGEEGLPRKLSERGPQEEEPAQGGIHGDRDEAQGSRAGIPPSSPGRCDRVRTLLLMNQCHPLSCSPLPMSPGPSEPTNPLSGFPL